MISLKAIDTALSLLNKFLGLIDRQNKNRRKSFERICEPLYKRLEPLAKEYYDIVHEANVQLAKRNPDYPTILLKLEKRRAAIIIARDGILGEVSAFQDRYGADKAEALLAKKAEFDNLAYAFARSVQSYFYHETDLAGEFLPSAISRLSERVRRAYLEDLAEGKRKRGLSAHKHNERDLRAKEVAMLRAMSKHALDELESNWAEVNKRYTALKLFCLS
jgi:hypothetical protein